MSPHESPALLLPPAAPPPRAAAGAALTWNTMGIGVGPRSRDHRGRLARLGSLVDRHRPAAVALQEVFCPRWRRLACRALRQRGYWVAAPAPAPGPGAPARMGSGLLLATAARPLAVLARPFSHRGVGEDRWCAAKGYLACRLPGLTVCTLHMQSDSWLASEASCAAARAAQLAELRRWAAFEAVAEAAPPVWVLGDFNMSPREWRRGAGRRTAPLRRCAAAPTWAGRCLDRLLCTGPRPRCRRLPVVDPRESDHHALLFAPADKDLCR